MALVSIRELTRIFFLHFNNKICESFMWNPSQNYKNLKNVVCFLKYALMPGRAYNYLVTKTLMKYKIIE